MSTLTEDEQVKGSLPRLTPEMLRLHAQRTPTIGWSGQARQLLTWAADALEAAEKAINEESPPHVERAIASEGGQGG